MSLVGGRIGVSPCRQATSNRLHSGPVAVLTRNARRFDSVSRRTSQRDLSASAMLHRKPRGADLLGVRCSVAGACSAAWRPARRSRYPVVPSRERALARPASPRHRWRRSHRKPALPRLVELRARVVVIDNLSAAPRTRVPDSVVRILEGDILDNSIMERAFAFRPSVVFHLAAAFASERSVNHPIADLLSNGLGTLRMLERARQAATERFRLYVIKLRVRLGHPASDDRTSRIPPARYSISDSEVAGRVVRELLLRDVRTARRRFATLQRLRTRRSTGADRNVIPNFIAAALDGETIGITGSGEESRDFTYVDDIVDAMLLSGWQEAAIGRTINIGTGIETTIRRPRRS